MALFPKVLMKAPKTSNFDLSRKSRFTAAPGLLYPVLVEDCLPGDKINLDINSLVKTYPTLAPILGSFKLQFDVFYCPWKNYLPNMHSNTPSFNPQNMPLPYLRFTPQESDYTNTYSRVAPGSLLDFLGFPVGFTAMNTGSTDFNAIPFLAYYDIVRNYYSNPNETRQNGNPQSSLCFYKDGKVSFSDGASLDLLARGYNTLVGSNSSGPCINNTNPFAFLCSRAFSDPMGQESPMDGLCLRTYSPDLNSAWVQKGQLDSITLNVIDSKFTINQFRTANKLTKYLEKTKIAGSRYDEYIRANYGVTDRSDLMYPEFLGSASTEIMFDDVVSTAPADASDQPLGSLAGRGYGLLSSRKHFLNVKNHGTLMVMMSIVPRVDYCTGIRPSLRKTNFAHVYAPALDALGYQDKIASDLYALPALNSQGVPIEGQQDYTSMAVGQQPAWSEYMSAVNELHGDCASTLKYWTLARPFDRKDGTGVNRFDCSTYVFPQDYNYAFSDTSATAQNFIIQCKFGLNMRRPISKQLMPSL